MHGGPEIQIANKVEILSQYAGVYYQRTRKYPESNTSNGAADLTYQNPYTKKREIPSFHRIVVGKGISASLDADGARTKFYDDLLSGGIPKDTPKAHPGEIRCYVVDFLSPRGTIQGFVVQLIGKDGKPINGSRPGTSYVFALEDGKEYKPTQPPQLPFKGDPGFRPVTVWLLMDKLDPTFVLALTEARIPRVTEAHQLRSRRHSQSELPLEPVQWLGAASHRPTTRPTRSPACSTPSPPAST